MSHVTDVALIITVILLVIILGLLTYSIFFQKQKDRTRWKWIITVLTLAGTTFSGVLAAKAEPSLLLIGILGGLFSLPILALIGLEVTDYILGLRSGRTLFRMCLTIYEQHIANGRSLEVVASELNIPIERAEILVQALTISRIV